VTSGATVTGLPDPLEGVGTLQRAGEIISGPFFRNYFRLTPGGAPPQPPPPRVGGVGPHPRGGIKN
jgi:hypothetical protein